MPVSGHTCPICWHLLSNAAAHTAVLNCMKRTISVEPLRKCSSVNSQPIRDCYMWVYVIFTSWFMRSLNLKSDLGQAYQSQPNQVLVLQKRPALSLHGRGGATFRSRLGAKSELVIPIGGFHVDTPTAGWFIMENLKITWMITGGTPPFFKETSNWLSDFRGAKIKIILAESRLDIWHRHWPDVRQHRKWRFRARPKSTPGQCGDSAIKVYKFKFNSYLPARACCGAQHMWSRYSKR
jgi:hypothetical protein